MRTITIVVLIWLVAGVAAHAGDPCAPVWDHAPGQPGVGNNSVFALLSATDVAGPGAQFVAGGSFTSAGGSSVHRLGVWDGSQWSALGGGADGVVNALAMNGDSLFAAGLFTSVGGVNATNIARWDGAAWHALGGGVNGEVFALCAHDDGGGGGPALYVGGAFTQADGDSAFHIAKWDGDAWTPLSTGMNGNVRALVSWDDGSGVALYALGSFTSAGGVGVNNIARWDGAQWHALGAGLNGTALCAAADPSTGSLVVGGVFTSAGGTGALRVARWDGTLWHALGAGLDGTVRALGVIDLGDGAGEQLYAGGDFTLAGGAFAPRLARWSGGAWSATQSTVSGAVHTLAPIAPNKPGDTPRLVVGGTFTTFASGAAGRVAQRVGCALDDPPPPCPGDTNGDRVVDFTDFSAVLGAYGQTGAPGWIGADLNGDGTVDFTDFTLVLGNFATKCD